MVGSLGTQGIDIIYYIKNIDSNHDRLAESLHVLSCPVKRECNIICSKEDFISKNTI